MNLGLKKVRKGVGSNGNGGGFKVGLSRRSKERIVGFKTLDPRNHSVVILDENSNLNLLLSVDESLNFGSGLKNLLQPSFLN